MADIILKIFCHAKIKKENKKDIDDNINAFAMSVQLSQLRQCRKYDD